ncbi:hypothetical protein [Vagococcus carniphilus]|uniref:hypothetical protein n=1 Tax=Vagococcus carniphilus TaxID=218144 RepID=UPI00163C6FAB|nr:hypothetical protein [Vagococcus carniphilus]QNN73688.1 hypothetical protein H9L18_03585 [Vagococcus carniphilus]
MLKLIVFGTLINFAIFFKFGPGLSGINVLFTIGLLGILYDLIREKKQAIRNE